MVSRRMILKTGVAAIVVLGVGGGIWAGTRNPDRALAPWRQAGTGYGDARLDALAYAVLSPNPHNRQPWLVQLIGDDALDLYCDLDRRLPETDPFDRQITVGLGCFSELFRMAAAEAGYKATIVPFPDGEPSPRLDSRRVARIRLVKEIVKKDQLFDAVFDRRSVKEPFDISKPIASTLLADLVSGERHGGTVDMGVITGLRELSWNAHEVETLTPRTMQESVDLMRFGKTEIEANPDGIDFGGPAFELMNVTGLMTRENVGDPASTSFKQGMKIYDEMLHSAMGYVWITSAGNTRTQQLIAGRDWVRLNLRATQLGLAVHPLSQALQEYSEMDELYAALHKSLGIEAPSRLQMFARIGYGPRIEPSPRWPMKTRLIKA
ncbi:MAG: twin-arginine translocation pathway signal protein [Kordiimonadales bacterium]|nr:MAG: twin-arginine translocation pathway signal protein [Kordiimonadales bacterium]